MSKSINKNKNSKTRSYFKSRSISNSNSQTGNSNKSSNIGNNNTIRDKQNTKLTKSIKNENIRFKLDATDHEIIKLLISNYESIAISKRLDIPLSTIQRRMRKLFDQDIVRKKIELNYGKVGYKRGMLHIFLKKGFLDEIGKKIVQLQGILSVSVQVGNSDLVANLVYKDSHDLLDIISDIKSLEGIEKVLWSEEVYNIHK